MRQIPTSIRSWASILAVLILCVGASQSGSARPVGSSASGTYQFSLEDGYAKYVDFQATSAGDGSATGQLTISDEAPIGDQDVDGTGDRELGGSREGFYLTVDLDGLVINRNVAVMSGTVRDSNVNGYVGQRVLLVVEDNGENGHDPDRLAWGLYKTTARNWTPADAELREDNGASLTWTATDAERRDDPGIPSRGSESITCQTFPVDSYSFFDVQHGAGDIVVRA